MRRPLLLFLTGLLAGVVLVVAVPGFSQEEGGGHAKYGRKVSLTPADMQKAMEKWQASATPGVHHERLRYFLGDWTITSKIWMGGEPQTATGTAKFSWLMEGRWLRQELTSTMPGMPGPWVGFGITGYDNFRKAYVGCWVDGLSTALLTFSGNIDATGKRIEEFGTMDEPSLDQVGKMARYVTQIVDEDTFRFEIHDLDAIGGETKMIEVTYKRVKAK
jgi:hypothetical protein